MRDLIERIDKLNSSYAKDLGEEYESVFAQGTARSVVPEYILALDGKNRLKCSPQMSEVYRVFDSWTDAFLGKTIVSPHNVEKLLQEGPIIEAINMVARFSAPYPPAIDGDYQRTTIYAYDPDELRFSFFWWENTDDDEPCIVDFDEGHIGVFASLKDHFHSLIDEETATAEGLKAEERIRNRSV